MQRFARALFSNFFVYNAYPVVYVIRDPETQPQASFFFTFPASARTLEARCGAERGSIMHARRRFAPRVEALEPRWVLTNNPALVPPALSSLPGAPATIYLDFTGDFTATWANFNNIDTPPFDLDGNSNSFNSQEQQAINTIWRNAAEDYAPFKINVTTVQPPSFAPGVALKVDVGGDGKWLGAAAGGVALLSTFANSTGSTPPCFAFAALFGNSFKAIGDVCAHEAGHMFGLQHQSEYDPAGKQINQYYAGLTDGTAPIMGNSYAAARSLWWYGTSAVSSTTFQDDMAVIGSAVNKFGLRSDDAGNTAAGAKAIPNQAKGKANLGGVITTMSDVDWFSFKARPGPVSFTVDVPDPYNNLDAKVELRNGQGQVIASDDPAGSFDATVTANLTVGGTYYVVVSSHGKSSASTATNYGQDVGSYQLTGTFLPFFNAVRIYAPTRWQLNAATNVYSGQVTVSSVFTVFGPFTLTIKLPNSSLRWIAPNAVQTGNTVVLTFNSNLVKGHPFRVNVKIADPLHKPLGTFFIGVIGKLT